MPAAEMTEFFETLSDGRVLELRRVWDIDDNGNDGWIVHVVEAYLNKVPAGFLKISYIPKQRMDDVYPTALHFSARYCGKHPGLQDLFARGVDDPTTEGDLREALDATDQWYDRPRERDTWNIGQLREEWLNRRASIERDEQQKFDAFNAFHTDRPIVDYIKVFNGSDAFVPYINGERCPDAPVAEAQRRGVGTQLYFNAARWMNEHGLRLYASGSQTDEAQAVWATFEQQGIVQVDLDGEKPRRYLNVQD